MIEEEYIKLAEERAACNVATKHWQWVLDKSIWVSHDNIETPFNQLDSQHIFYIINGLLDFEHPLCKEIVRELSRILYERCRKKKC